MPFEVFSSLGPFSWRVLSDCAITWVPHGVTFLWQANVGNYMKKNFFFTFDFHIWTQTHRWYHFSLALYFNKNGDHPWGRCWPIYLESKPFLNCWIAVERAPYLYNGNPYAWKDSFYIEIGPRPDLFFLMMSGPVSVTSTGASGTWFCSSASSSLSSGTSKNSHKP